jgi:hypothetical protein
MRMPLGLFATAAVPAWSPDLTTRIDETAEALGWDDAASWDGPVSPEPRAPRWDGSINVGDWLPPSP